MHGSRLPPLALSLALAGWAAPALARVELGAPAGKADITVGCMFPMTGRSGIYGRDSIGGIRVALDRLRRFEPGAPRIRVIVEDSASKISYALRLAEDFVRRDRVQVLCGVVSSGVGEAVSRFAARHDVIFIGTDHASSRLTIEELHPRYFRVSNDTFASMAAGARYLAALKRTTPWRRLAFIGADYDYGHVSLTDLRTLLDALGVDYELVGEFWPKLYEPDYSQYIGALMAAKPEVVVAALWGGDFIAFLKQAAATDFFDRVRLANFDTGGNYDMLVAMGTTPPPGLILSARHHNNWPDTPLNRWFVSTFYSLEGRYPTYAAEGAYSGIMAIAAAVRKAGGAKSTERLIRALEGLTLDLPEDPPGHPSRIDPSTHQIAQAQAIGEIVPDDRFPPAKVMLGRWVVYPPDLLQPPPDVVRRRRDDVARRKYTVE